MSVLHYDKIVKLSVTFGNLVQLLWTDGKKMFNTGSLMKLNNIFPTSKVPSPKVNIHKYCSITFRILLFYLDVVFTKQPLVFEKVYIIYKLWNSGKVLNATVDSHSKIIQLGNDSKFKMKT